MQQTIIQVVTALLGSLGFAFMFNLGKRNVIPAAVNGMCTWIVYILVRNIIDDVFIPSLAASLWAAIYAEIAARIMKAPANQYLIVGLIPLLPGVLLSAGINSSRSEQDGRGFFPTKDSANIRQVNPYETIGFSASRTKLNSSKKCVLHRLCMMNLTLAATSGESK